MSRRKQSNPRQFRRAAAPDSAGKLELIGYGPEAVLHSGQMIPAGTLWGPFTGKIKRAAEVNDVSLVMTGSQRWLEKVMWVSADDSLNNCVVYSNEDIFSCKKCGIWFRNDNHLQDHLMYYCSNPNPPPTHASTAPQRNPNPPPSHTSPAPQCNPNPPPSHASTALQCNSPPSPVSAVLQWNTSLIGTQALELHLSTHSTLKTEAPPAGSSLECTICAHPAETLLVLQHHALSHLSQTGLRCSDCHFTFQTPRNLQKHQELHRHGADKKRTRTLRSLSDLGNLDCPVLQSIEQESNKRDQKDETNSKSKLSFSYTRVKSEPKSPRLASSPIQSHVTPAFPVHPFLPQVAFSQNIGPAPQASEMLTKMSELVHCRLHHGRHLFPTIMYGMLVPKERTCFECNIAFGNFDNYLLHRKHYCKSRWQTMMKNCDSTVWDKSTDLLSGVGFTQKRKGRYLFGVNGPNYFNVPLVKSFSAGGNILEESPAHPLKASTPPDVTEILKDSKMSPQTETQTDHSQTTCEACKITFSHQENFTVHKQFYCASRHNPPAKRASNKWSGYKKPFHTRKTRKMSDPMLSPLGSYLPTSRAPYISQNEMNNLKDQFHQRYNMIQDLIKGHPEPSLIVSRSALTSKCDALVGNTPIDLSKKFNFGQFSNLTDYHECTLCKISFNKVKDYLSHKQNFCPVDVKKEASDNPSSENPVPSNAASPQELLSLKNESITLNVGHLKKMRLIDPTWPNYKINSADYATGVFVS